MADAVEQIKNTHGMEGNAVSSPKASGAEPEKMHSTPPSTEKFDRLKAILREMFQLDRGDLDFGLYRIMNLKAKEIEAFLDNDLLPQVRTALAGNAAGTQAELEEKLAETRARASDLGIDPEAAPKVEELKQQLAEAKADVVAETDVYNHLANFFARYYDEGDFMSLRRYSGGGQPTYLIPYDGEEVKLHWANADQYYVKTTENYSSYVFTLGTGAETRRVRFEIAAADNEKDNVKEASGKQRRFLLAESERTKPVLSPAEGPVRASTSPLRGDAQHERDLVRPERSVSGVEGAVAIDNSELVVRFEHRPLTENEKRIYPGTGAKQQDRLNEAIANRILQALQPDWQALLTASAPTENTPERTVLDKHLAAYTAKNSFDYFIHKDLGGFLRRELDFYLKSDVLNLDDLALGDTARLDRALARMRAVRHVADKIIDFLAQLENFQKQLWLKKKFILETQYCITLDRVPEPLYAEIAANESQRAEWVKLFAIDEINNSSPLPLGEGQGEGGRVREGQGVKGEGTQASATPYTNPLTVEFLKANPYLLLDTRHFDADFTSRLLAALSEAGPLDEQTDGLLIHGENFQALNLLKARYQGQVNCIYIDPPFNTDASPILYKNGYKSSTWSSLMENGLRVSRTLLSEEGVLVAAIDDEQQRELNFLLSGVFHNRILGTILVRTNPSGRPTQSGYSVAHEYLIYAGQGQNSVIGRMPPTEEQAGRFSRNDERGEFEWRNLRREGSNSDRIARAALYYPIYIKGKKIRVPQMAWDYSANEWIVKEKPQTGEQVVYPDNEAGAQKTWRWEWKTVMHSLADLAVRKDRSGRDYVYYKRRPHEQGVVSISCWFDARYSATEHGTALLKAMFGESVFSYPKSIHAVIDAIYTAGASRSEAYVLDYFAGSGTTGHAVINLNREDGGDRKFILVEVGHHFDTVLLPRMKKVVYSSDWKDGKPVSRKGVSQLFKYVRLESYEDTLDSLEVTPPDSAQQDLLEQNSELAEDYRLRYALGEETSGSACLLGKDFTDPFAYTLSVVRDGMRREVPVDLPETFNYLLGLHVESRRRMDGVLAITGKDHKEKHCLILWRNLNETDNAALEKWFTRHRAEFAESLDAIYTNGDHTLNALKKRNETWTAKTIEPVFRELMFEETE